MPLRPSCAMCVSDCDPNAILTDCHHFLCVRCLRKYPQGACPRCNKPCRALRLGASNFPRDIVEKLKADPGQMMHAAAAALDFQRRQEAATVGRLKELVTGMNANLRATSASLEEAKTRCGTLEAQNRALRDESQALRHQVAELQQRQPFTGGADHSRGGGGGGLFEDGDVHNHSRQPLQHGAPSSSAPWPSPSAQVQGARTPQPNWSRGGSLPPSHKRARGDRSGVHDSPLEHLLGGGGNSMAVAGPSTPTVQPAFHLDTPAVSLRDVGAHRPQSHATTLHHGGSNPAHRLTSLLPPGQATAARIVRSSSGQEAPFVQ